MTIPVEYLIEWLSGETCVVLSRGRTIAEADQARLAWVDEVWGDRVVRVTRLSPREVIYPRRSSDRLHMVEV